MRLRPVSLLLAPLWLLLALAVLSSCTAGNGSAAGGGGVATAFVGRVITVMPAGTTVPGIVPNGTPPPSPAFELPTAIPTLPSASLSPTELKYRILDQF